MVSFFSSAKTSSFTTLSFFLFTKDRVVCVFVAHPSSLKLSGVLSEIGVCNLLSIVSGLSGICV